MPQDKLGNSKKKLYIYNKKQLRKKMALRGESHPAHKLTEVQVNSIRTLYKIGHRNIKVLARNNGVSPANIRRIVKGETWRHLLHGKFNDYQ